MASDEASGGSVSFGEAIRVEKLDLHTYKINLHDAFCIGNGMGIMHYAPLFII